MKNIAMTAAVLAVLGMVSSVAMAENKNAGVTGELYSLTKSCAKGKVLRAGKTRCEACPKATHPNRKQTKCLWDKKMKRGSYTAPKKYIPKGSY